MQCSDVCKPRVVCGSTSGIMLPCRAPRRFSTATPSAPVWKCKKQVALQRPSVAHAAAVENDTGLNSSKEKEEVEEAGTHLEGYKLIRMRLNLYCNVTAYAVYGALVCTACCGHLCDQLETGLRHLNVLNR